MSELADKIRNIANGLVLDSYPPSETDPLYEALDLIDRLPVTADGVPVVPGMTVYTNAAGGTEDALVTSITNYRACGVADGQQAFMHGGNDCHPDCDAWTDTSKAFSTPQAAEAAAKERE